VAIHLIALLVRIRELEAEDVFFIESVALQGVNCEGRLEAVLEVSEAQNDLLVGADLTRDQPQ